MFRRWISSFVKKNKKVIIDIAKKVGILIMIALLATAIMSGIGKNTPSTSQTNDSISIYKPAETIIEGKKVETEEFDKDEKVIDNFMAFCNNRDIESAYNLLSDDCKKELYPSLEEFKDSYYSKFFETYRQYNLQSWINEQTYHTYKVNYIDDLLSTGEYDNSKKGQDFITVVTVESEKQINLNGFIKKEEIKKESGGEDIKSLVVERKVFVDYLEYTVKIKNMTESPILLDTGRKRNSIKLIDENNVVYYPFKDRISNLNNLLSSGVIRTLNIRFNKTYSVNIKDKYIEFSDIVTDLEKYNNSESYEERKTVMIEI